MEALSIKTMFNHNIYPNSKVHGANTGSIWSRQDPGGPHVGPMNFAVSVVLSGGVPHGIIF